jgi:hypothetical protein
MARRARSDSPGTLVSLWLVAGSPFPSPQGSYINALLIQWSISDGGRCVLNILALRVEKPFIDGEPSLSGEAKSSEVRTLSLLRH